MTDKEAPKKTGKNSKKKKADSRDEERRTDGETGNSSLGEGGMDFRNFKKNLGCGG